MFYIMKSSLELYKERCFSQEISAEELLFNTKILRKTSINLINNALNYAPVSLKSMKELIIDINSKKTALREQRPDLAIEMLSQLSYGIFRI